MFLGHFAVGYALKRKVPRASLGTLLAAPLWLDLLWPAALLLGIETVRIVPGDTVVTPLDLHEFPWTHSLLMALVWSALFGGVYAGRTGDRAAGGWLAAGVLSHWVLDAVAHRPDLPLWPGGSRLIGFGLWNSLPGTLVVEFGLYGAGVWIYSIATRARDRVGHWGWWGTVAFVAALYLLAVFGPPPPNERAIGWMGLSTWGLLAWFARVDRHRERRSTS